MILLYSKILNLQYNLKICIKYKKESLINKDMETLQNNKVKVVMQKTNRSLNRIPLTLLMMSSPPNTSTCPGSISTSSPFLYHEYVGLGLPTALQRHLIVLPGSMRRCPMENGKYGRAENKSWSLSIIFLFMLFIQSVLIWRGFEKCCLLTGTHTWPDRSISQGWPNN